MRTKLFSLMGLALIVSACNATSPSTDQSTVASPTSVATPIAPTTSAAPSIAASPTATPVNEPDLIGVATPAPTATPSPSPSATPTPTTVSFNVIETNQTVFNICQAFRNFNTQTTIIQLNYTGYFYSFAATGVTVTYQTGPENGQTFPVNSQTDLVYGVSLAAGCALSIDNGILLSVTYNQ